MRGHLPPARSTQVGGRFAVRHLPSACGGERQTLTASTSPRVVARSICCRAVVVLARVGAESPLLYLPLDEVLPVDVSSGTSMPASIRCRNGSASVLVGRAPCRQLEGAGKLEAVLGLLPSEWGRSTVPPPGTDASATTSAGRATGAEEAALLDAPPPAVPLDHRRPASPSPCPTSGRFSDRHQRLRQVPVALRRSYLPRGVGDQQRLLTPTCTLSPRPSTPSAWPATCWRAYSWWVS